MQSQISLSAIHTFTVVAQKLSFTQAAELLHITPSAVSHQMKLLESQLGVVLFHRKSKGVKLSIAGEALQKHAAPGMKDIQQGLAQCLFASKKEKLVIAAIPSLCQTWLLQRINQFCEQNPNIEIELVALDQLADFSIHHCDAHIHFGAGDYRGLEAKFLANEYIYPVCHPELLSMAPSTTLETLLQHGNMLHYKAGAEDAHGGITWANWAPEITVNSDGGLQQMWFSHVVLAIAAAKLKQGVALGWHHVVKDDIASGQLARISSDSRKASYAYYFVTPHKSWQNPSVVTFYQWLEQTMSRENVSLHESQVADYHN